MLTFFIIINFKTDRYLNRTFIWNIKTEKIPIVTSKIFFPRENEAIKHDLVEFKVQCLKVFCYHGNKSTILLFNSIFRTTPEVSTKLYFVEIVKSQRSYGFLITEELIFWLPNFGIYFHFSASLRFSGKAHALGC